MLPEANKLYKEPTVIREGEVETTLETEECMLAARKECKALSGIRPGELDYARQFASSLIQTMTQPVYHLNRVQEFGESFFYRNTRGTVGSSLFIWTYCTGIIDHSKVSLQGKANWQMVPRSQQDTFWDAWDIDDRGIDNDNFLAEGMPASFNKAGHPEIRTKYGGDGLPLDIRVKMVCFRHRWLAPPAEALQPPLHISAGLSDQIESYLDMFLMSPNASRDAGFLKRQFHAPPVCQQPEPTDPKSPGRAATSAG